jgi:hypothetical protein
LEGPLFRGKTAFAADQRCVNVKEITEIRDGTVQTLCIRAVIIGTKGRSGHAMPIVIRVGLLGLALAFGAVAADAAAQGMGSGPIQTLPWAAKQRAKPTRDTQKGTEADAQPTDQLRAAPIAGTGPVEAQSKN